MVTRCLVAGTAAAVIALAASLSGQSDPQKMTPDQIAAELRKPTRGFVQQKTARGDPDISGVWTSDAALGIARERDAKYAGRPFLTDEEFNEAHKADEQRRVAGENAVGAFRNDGAWKTRSYRQTSLVIEPEDGHTPAFTDKAQTRAATRDRGSFGEGPFDSTLDFTLYDRCITRGIVGSVMPVVYGNGNRIIQAPGQVIISYEMVHDTRVIYTDGRPHIGKGIRQLLGDSRGHWEGNTLVVETTNLSEKTSIGLNGNGLRHSEEMMMTERITRVGPDELRYEVRINDPKTYVAPFTISLPLVSPSGYKLLPYECLEGDYAVANALSAERAEDRALEEDAKKGIVRPRKAITQDNVNAPRPTE